MAKNLKQMVLNLQLFVQAIQEPVHINKELILYLIDTLMVVFHKVLIMASIITLVQLV